VAATRASAHRQVLGARMTGSGLLSPEPCAFSVPDRLAARIGRSRISRTFGPRPRWAPMKPVWPLSDLLSRAGMWAKVVRLSGGGTGARAPPGLFATEKTCEKAWATRLGGAPLISAW
jgi:hypothetical protein